MSRQQTKRDDKAVAEAANRVRLRGKVSTPPEERSLPSGTTIVTLRLSVPREVTPMTDGSRQTADWVDCAAWGGRSGGPSPAGGPETSSSSREHCVAGSTEERRAPPPGWRSRCSPAAC